MYVISSTSSFLNLAVTFEGTVRLNAQTESSPSIQQVLRRASPGNARARAINIFFVNRVQFKVVHNGIYPTGLSVDNKLR